MNIKRLMVVVAIIFFWTGKAFAVPEAMSVRAVDVTPSSFSIVWMTDVSAEPSVEVYMDSSMKIPADTEIDIQPMAGLSAEVASSARSKGIMKVRASGLKASTTYYVRAIITNPADTLSVGYSKLVEVKTAASVTPYRREADGTLKGFSNNPISFKVYIRPSNTSPLPGLGDLMVLEAEGASYPVSAFVGDGVVAPEGVININNVFGADMESMEILGGEGLFLRIYRGGMLSTLLHYRIFPDAGIVAGGSEPIKGFFADINIDANVDDSDFVLFKSQYRYVADDPSYNPDYNFVEDEDDRVDVKDFSRFSREYGRVGIE